MVVCLCDALLRGCGVVVSICGARSCGCVCVVVRCVVVVLLVWWCSWRGVVGVCVVLLSWCVGVLRAGVVLM